MSNTHMATAMTRLLNKLERRLGTAVINLPEHLSKNMWGQVIQEETLDTFSRYFPHKILYRIDPRTDKGKDGYFYIDESKIGGDVVIYGIKDLALDRLAKEGVYGGATGFLDRYSSITSVESLMMTQMSMDLTSMYNVGIYVQYEHPNRLLIKNSTNHDIMVNYNKQIDIYLFVKHPPSLATISPTKMEEFEKLALLDIKVFLYEGLKHFDGLESVYTNIDLKIQDWASADNDRETLVERYKDQYVSAANFNQPIMYTV